MKEQKIYTNCNKYLRQRKHDTKISAATTGTNTQTTHKHTYRVSV